MAYNNKNVVGFFWMQFYFLCPKPAHSIHQIPYIKKYLDLPDTILGVSEIRIRSVFHKQESVLKFVKIKYYDWCYDILHPVARIMHYPIIRQCLF